MNEIEPRVVPFGDYLELLDERRRLWERIERTEADLSRKVASKPEGREGLVTVYDSLTNEYLGCMGRETWEAALNGESPNAARQTSVVLLRSLYLNLVEHAEKVEAAEARAASLRDALEEIAGFPLGDGRSQPRARAALAAGSEGV